MTRIMQIASLEEQAHSARWRIESARQNRQWIPAEQFAAILAANQELLQQTCAALENMHAYD